MGWSAECGVGRVRYKHWSVNVKWGMYCLECEVGIVECEVWSVCKVRSVMHNVWNVKCGERHAKCGDLV